MDDCQRSWPRFDWTLPLRRLDRQRLGTFPSRTEVEASAAAGDSADESVMNRAFLMRDGHPGFEWGYVMRSRCGRLVAFGEQEKMPEGLGVQRMRELQSIWNKSLKKLSDRDWTSDDMIRLFKTCRPHGRKGRR